MTTIRHSAALVPALVLGWLACGCATGPPVYGAGGPLAYAPFGDLQKGYVRVIAVEAGPLPAGGGPPGTYLHVMLDVHNLGDHHTWTFHANEQRLSYGRVTVLPSFSRTSLGGPVLVGRAGTRTWMDLYYPLPRSAPKTLTISWKIRRGAEAATQSTEFSRLEGYDVESCEVSGCGSSGMADQLH